MVRLIGLLHILKHSYHAEGYYTESFQCSSIKALFCEHNFSSISLSQGVKIAMLMHSLKISLKRCLQEREGTSRRTRPWHLQDLSIHRQICRSGWTFNVGPTSTGSTTTSTRADTTVTTGGISRSLPATVTDTN